MLPPGLGGLAQILGYQSPYSVVPPLPSDGRTYYTGGIGPQATDPTPGHQLGPSYTDPSGNSYGPVPIGGYSQFAGIPNGTYSGYINPDFTAPVPGSNATPFPSSYPSPYGTPKPPEPPKRQAGTPKPPEPPPAPPMMGQWGGGAWASSNPLAPASMQPTWLTSMNSGRTWQPNPQYQASAPQYGQTTSIWGQAPNQDADSPTWVQR